MQRLTLKGFFLTFLESLAIILSLGGCVKSSDFIYSGDKTMKVCDIEDLSESIIDYGGCSGVVISTTGDKSYIATAQHCTNRARAPRFIWFRGKKYEINQMWRDEPRDISFLEVSGKLTPIKILLTNKPQNDDADTTIGFVDGKLTRLIGQAIPGQSGGGVFTAKGELWGTVSTTGTGVAIFPALERLKLLWILNAK